MPQQLFSRILTKATNLNASDIHIHPTTKYWIVRLRILNKLHTIMQLPLLEGAKLQSYLKFQASMDICEKRKPQSGQFEKQLNEKTFALRISALPDKLGSESLVIRLFHYQATIPFLNSTIFKASAKKIIACCHNRYGLFLFSGTTGSGKSNSMYSLANELCRNRAKHVITVEDPVEHYSPSFLQVEINEKAGLNYEKVLRAVLRHDPDILIIGEIRDSETAKMAIRAALTGHLVLSTIHASNLNTMITRLTDLGVTRDDLNDALLGISYQQLTDLYCPLCHRNCSIYCTHHPLKQTVLYETANDELLTDCINGQASIHSSIKKQYRKGVAYGFFAEKRLE
ncbi:competence type IV pilus ATPase ComGA [Listeria sp. PSOL-1]|uniref:competence type IV pilus ATPase ComGA n=1 Tax=Listeria sp. PSOL-1 TaxID=1844999 RepID=UPI0013D352F5|nr:competence type IV pilus ATPase ComGA [Listeria sp. PSOL-1]